ncbi:Septum formation initiator [Corynebacterium faecale]|uniref:septum formation initiator family protein n=1 Tax=Corynebacterium faecale TaxID=1758466 RepID=UPI0025B3D2EC|nr:septum formation initiator family protein [Corynebacterium faecale]WJY91713.1 Septum formation initiator [Corynebacterium faecale]
MAKQKKSHKGIVPVSSRDRAPETISAVRAPFRLGAVGVVVLALVVLLILMTVAIPLRNYFQQRSEIAHTEASIQAKELQIEELSEELDRYQSEAYVREQARRRLGVIEPGETAFRILDPALDSGATVTSDGTEEEARGTWYETLWESVTEPELLEPEELPAPVDVVPDENKVDAVMEEPAEEPVQ